MRVVLGGASAAGGGGNEAEVELGGASKTAPTLSDTLRGKDIIVLQTSGRPATLSGSGLVLGCAPVEQVGSGCRCRGDSRDSRRSNEWPCGVCCTAVQSSTAAVSFSASSTYAELLLYSAFRMFRNENKTRGMKD